MSKVSLDLKRLLGTIGNIANGMIGILFGCIKELREFWSYHLRYEVEILTDALLLLLDELVLEPPDELLLLDELELLLDAE